MVSINNVGYRVKLLNLPDYAQAVVHVRDELYIEMKLYLYNSVDEHIQFVAPFAFDTREARDQTFANDERLTEFAKSVIYAQMVSIDPSLNLDNFKFKPLKTT
jgi:hypothetical protein